MNPERWQQVLELYGRVEALSEEERERVLAEEAVERPDVVDEVRSLLASEPPEGFVTPLHSEPRVPEADNLFGGGLGGLRVGDFVLREELGRGGMGVVYAADQLELERRVAVKILPLAKLGQGQALERFRREAKAASTLDHPHVGSVLAYGEGESTAWYAMRCVEGHDLAREIGEQRKDVKGEASGRLLPAYHDPTYIPTVVERMRDLAVGLQHAHDHGIVHRDVKPQNILLDRDGRLVLVDFGLALDERFGVLSQSGELRGTPHYMSPEQVHASRSRVDHRTDIYSLGIVLYELLSLRRPYDGRTSEEVMAGIVRREPEPIRSLNPRVPRDLALICDKAMSKEPAGRYATARAVAADLDRFLRHEAILAKPPTLRERAGRKLRAHRQAVRTAGIVLATVLVGLALAQWREVRAAEARLPRVALAAAVDATTGAPLDVAAVATAVPLDPRDDRRAASIDLGRLPLAELPLSPGRYRIEVRAPGYAPVELTRWLELDAAPTELEPRLSPLDAAERGMVRVEAGRLALGTDRPLGCLDAAPPETALDLDPFWIDEAEVTNGAFLAFLEASGHPVPDYWRRAGYATSWRELPVEGYEDAWAALPVVGVSWFDARAFAEWNGKRLVTHPEFELAFADVSTDLAPEAANVGGRRWGDWPSGDWRAAYRLYLENAQAARDERCRQGALGLLHAFGNVDEFTESFFVELFRSRVRIDASKRIYYGGNWSTERGSSDRHNVHGQVGAGEKYSSNHIGFRCARSASAPVH